MKYLKPANSPYEYVAFITGFSLLAYELVASRILAPAIGSSIYVWTSVIGVIIAALSLGYATGGRLADKRVNPLDIAWLLLASSAAAVVTLLSADGALAAITATRADPRMQGLIAAVVLFMPTSFLLGMISPYLARLKNVSVATTGTTIASLSALNSLGGIVGTFCTGFIFFAYIGSKETLLLVSLLLLAASWLIQPKILFKKRILYTLLIILVAFVAIRITKQSAVVATIDTPSSSYKVIDFNYEGKSIRGIATGPGGIQSGIYRDGSKELAFTYTRKMAELVEQVPQKESILILGGGALTLPQYLANKYPSSKIDVVEIDPKLAPIARQYFNYRDPANVTIISEDARVFLNQNTKQYDVVLVDVYTDTAVPFSLTTVEYTAKLANAVTEDGVVAANIIGALNSGCDDLLSGLHASYVRQFPFYEAYPLRDASLQTTQNIIVAYSKKRLPWPALLTREVKLPTGRTLTDDFSPVERLKQQCEV